MDMEDLTLNIGNSVSQLKGLNVAQLKQLKEILCYRPSAQEIHFSKFGVKVKYLIDAKGKFPTGLLDRVTNWCMFSGAKIKVIDTRIRPRMPQDRLFTLSLGHTPYEDQLAAIKAARTTHSGIISASTGMGKSIMIALLIDALQVKTLIVVPTLELKRQLSESFTSYFGSLSNITIENIGSPALEKKGNYDCLIIDEAHHSGAATYRRLNNKVWDSIFYRYHFTATPFRSKDNEQILFESVCGSVIYTVDYTVAVSKGYIVPMEAYYLNVPNANYSKSYHAYSAAYSELIVDNFIRNNIIVDILKNLKKARLSTLCLVKEIAHGQELAKMTGFPFVSGEKEGTKFLIRLFNERKIDVLIGTMGVLGEGVDTKPCEYVVLASPVKSRNLFMQCCGRAFRRFQGKASAKIILFKDSSHRWFASAFSEQKKILKQEYGAIPGQL